MERISKEIEKKEKRLFAQVASKTTSR